MSNKQAHALIEEAEYNAYKEIVHANYLGEGVIVDAGCFAGASTRAMCEGIRGDQLHERRKWRPVIAIDRFTVSDNYVAEHFLETGIDIRHGESFLPVFMENLSEFIDHIEIRAGDLTQVGRVARPIEVAAIDIAKSPALNAYVASRWFDKLIPGRSILIHQDFYAPSQPWIAVSMGGIGDYFSVINEKVGESAIFKLERPVPPTLLQDALQVSWRTTRGLRMLDVAASRLAVENRAPLLLMKALGLNFLGRVKEAREILHELATLNPPPSDQKWRKWLAMAFVAVDPGALAKDRMLADIYMSDAVFRLGEWQ